MKRRIPFHIARVLLIIGVIALALGFLVMQLWNALVPQLFAGPVITFWQAVGLLLLARLLTFSGGPARFSAFRHHQWRRRYEERMASMSPDQRERMRRAWGRHCGPWGEDDPFAEHAAPAKPEADA